jgi:hypothetical protein
MASSKLAQRQIIAEITPLAGGDVTGPNLSGYFAQVSGGEITAAVEKIYVGGTPFPEVLCAPSEVGDLTLTKHYDTDLRTVMKDLRLVVGRAYYELKIYDTDCDLKNSQSERIYSKALLTGLSEPEGDASSGAPATIALTFAVSGAPTQ